MNTWPPISRDDLRVAASSAGFDTVFPLLVRRLIAETAEGLESLDMPGGSGVAAGGFDGVVRAGRSSAFVPEGTSIWELSVGGGQRKADDDYLKRLDAPDGLATADVVYVEAILAPWTKARSWAKDRSREGRWREVRGYNLDRMHAWLDQAPATTAWLASQLHRAMPGVRSLTSWWNNSWLQSTSVPLDSSIVLAGREETAKDLISALTGKKSIISLAGDLRADEACAFVAAAVDDASVLDRETLGARCLYVSDPTSLEQLVAQPKRLILLLADPSLARELPSSHPHQLIVLTAPGGTGEITVPRIDGQLVAARFESAGMQPDEASRLGVLGRRSILALRRTLSTHSVLYTPKWAVAPDSFMRRVLLLGSWNNSSDEDRRIVESCTGIDYERVQDRAEQLTVGNDIPFLSRVSEIWHVVAFEDSWTLLAPLITKDDLGAFRKVALEVLGEPDPLLELEPNKQWWAGITGTRRKFSGDIRRGLSGTLALMGSSEIIVHNTGETLSDFATLTVRKLLSEALQDSSYRGWLSLVDVLGDLAEASPREFLDAMRTGLNGENPAHVAMFQDSEPDQFGIGSSSAHPNFLWALEKLSWSADYIDEATDILAQLAEVDPGGQLANRPIASLIGVLSAWCPNTAASTEDRIRCIRGISARYPDVGRRLLLALIPDGREFQTVHPGPRFREWKSRVPVTRQDLTRVVDVVVELLANNLGNRPEFLCALVEKLDDIAIGHREVICRSLIEVSAVLSETGKSKLYEALRGQLARHREYADTNWSLSEDELRPIQDVCDALTPSDPVLRHAWMFRSDWVTLGDIKRRDDYSGYDAELAVRRASAIGDILQFGGIEAVLGLAATTEYSGIIGAAIANYSSEYDDSMLELLENGDDRAKTVAAGYFRVRLFEGEYFRDTLLAATDSPTVQAALLRLTNDPPAAWKKLKDLDPKVGEFYWREFVYFGLGHDFASVLEAAWSMLDVGRPAAVLDLMVLYIRKIPRDKKFAEVVATALEMLLTAGNEDPELCRLNHYHFEQLFALLAEHRETLGNQRVVALEWQMYPITGLKADAPSLHRALVEDSGFFVELVSRCFRADTPMAGEEEGGSGSDERSTALRAYDVLRSCILCPGVDESGEMNAGLLRDWVHAARLGLSSADRLHIGDRQIGELLANAPASSDGTPLHEVVRDLLEEVRSDEMERGIEIGIHNSRGVTSRGVYEGGAQEWALANNYRGYAEASKFWPRTRRIFQDLANSFEADARRLELEAERRRQGLGS